MDQYVYFDYYNGYNLENLRYPGIHVELHFPWNKLEERVFNLINIERQKYGLSQLGLFSQIFKIAKDKAMDMALYNDPNHYSARFGGDEGVQLRKAGINHGAWVANIYWGKSNPVKAWMNSPGHRNNILNPHINYIGVAGYKSPSTQLIYWSMIGTASL